MKQSDSKWILIIFFLCTLLNSCNVFSPQTEISPTPEIPPGWKSYEINNFSFRLPDTYQDDTVLYKETYPEVMEYIFFLAREVYGSEQTSKTIFTLTKDKVEKRIFFDEYVDKYIDQADPQYEILSRTKLYGEFPTEKIISRNNQAELPHIYITYLTFVGNKIYRIEIQCEESNYEVDQDEFEEIYQNIRITQKNGFTSLAEKYQGLACLGLVTFAIIILSVIARLNRQKKNNAAIPPTIPEDL